MNYFSRLTDIVTCNLGELLRTAADPLSAVRLILREMEDGIGGAKRSVATAAASEDRLAAEIESHRTQIAYWSGKAREDLLGQREDEARVALVRKREVEDLIAALEQQKAAARTTRDNLATTLRALEARHAEAYRKYQELIARSPVTELTETSLLESRAAGSSKSPVETTSSSHMDDLRASQIESELDALRRELGQR